MTVEFPRTGDDRSTTAAGRGIVADALAQASPTGARAAEHETNWRINYLQHFRHLTAAGLDNPTGARQIAADGLTSVAARFQWAPDGSEAEVPLSEFAAAGSGRRTPPGTEELRGSGDRVTELALPVGKQLLTGGELFRQVDAWVEAGVVEPSVAESLRTVAANPEWLSLPRTTLIALGAGAEAGPTPTLLRWGARVAGLDLPKADIWKRVLANAAECAGTLLVPTRSDDTTDRSGDLAGRAGLDVLTQLPETLDWINSLDAAGGSMVLGNYIYADGGTNVRAAAAGDALLTQARLTNPELGSAFLATPTDVFIVPGEAVARSGDNWDNRPAARKSIAHGLRALSGGRLLFRNYAPGSAPDVHDALVPQQGPNYALGKRIHRWRGTVDRAEGRRTSLNIAPPTRTRSVTKNRALAAAYAGAHRFGVEVFEPATTRVLMAALLVHDLYADARPAFEQPWQEEAYQAAHGGLWTTAYSPRSALGLAAVLGYAASRP